MKKVLVIGGTGAMGIYLVPELLRLGFKVDVVALVHPESDTPDLTYIKVNALDIEKMRELIKAEYDAILDFMVYNTKELMNLFFPMYLAACSHYIYLSTYRVYADEEHPIKETSPRLIDVSKDEVLLKSGDYCIYKAEGEDILKARPEKHWSIIRPAITYSQRRFQLITYEMDIVIRRMMEGKVIPIPDSAIDKQATMSWGGDVGRMIARLVLNPGTFGEAYSACTAEHHTWREIAEMYKRIGGLKYTVVDTDTYINFFKWHPLYPRQQLIYDRCFDRIMDNTKILNATGMKQFELMSLEEGLRLEYSRLPKNMGWANNSIYNEIEKVFKDEY